VQTAKKVNAVAPNALIPATTGRFQHRFNGTEDRDDCEQENDGSAGKD
jgi:hypothetical protein